MASRTQRMEALYATLPKIDCQGKCWHSCGPITMSALEYDRVRARVGKPIPSVTRPLQLCPLLSADHRCTVYEVRPLICRMWGVAEGMPCPFGCKPERLLSRAEVHDLLRQAALIGGSDAGPALALMQQMLKETDRRMQSLLGKPRGK